MILNRTRICMVVVNAIVFLTIQYVKNQHQQWSDYWSQHILVNNQGTTVISSSSSSSSSSLRKEKFTNRNLLSIDTFEGGQLALIAAPSLTNDNMHIASISEQHAKHPIDDQIQKPVSHGREELNAKVVPPFLPNQVLEQYKTWHNKDVLDMEFKRMKDNNQSLDRKFSIVHYLCPDRAGAVFHNMYNTITWSIITNRTMLFRFDNTSSSGDTEEGCDMILKLSEWIPKYDDWYIPLQLNTETYQPISIPLDSENIQFENEHRTVTFPQTGDIRSKEKIYRNDWVNNPMVLLKYREYIQKMDERNQVIAKSLYHEGSHFLFGMLFREIFEPNQNIMSQITDMIPQSFFSSSKNIFSIGLHSRHPVDNDVGNYTNQEIQCLNNMLPAEEVRTLDTCFVFLMSDRILTIDLLSKWLIENNCTPVSVNTTDNELMPGDEKGRITTFHSRHSEHGPRAGVGFMKDLFLSSHARSGYIGAGRSSSLLVIELITYEQKIDAWKKNISQTSNDIIQPELRMCDLHVRSHIRGYNYGPGTPTYIKYKKNA